MENLPNFHLDLRSPRYRNSPKIFYLGMNHGIGWNPKLKESYVQEYSKYEAETFTHGTLGIYLRPVNVLALDPSLISRYSECTKTTSFSILGFSCMKP